MSFGSFSPHRAAMKPENVAASSDGIGESFPGMRWEWNFGVKSPTRATKSARRLRFCGWGSSRATYVQYWVVADFWNPMGRM